MAQLAGRYRVEISTDTDTLDRLWGDDLWGEGDYGAGTVWDDLACEVDFVTIETGRRTGITRPDVGRLSMSATSWWPSIAAPNTPPVGRPFRLLIDPTGDRQVWEPLFVGTLEDGTMTQTGQPGGPHAGWQLVATDTLGTLQRIDPQQGEYPRPAEPARTRIAALCAWAGVAYSWRNTLPDVNVQARDTAGPLLQELGLAADSAGLSIAAHRAGAVLVLPEDPAAGWAGRHWIAGHAPDPLDDTPRRWLGCPTVATVRLALGELRNRFTVGNAGQPATVRDDPASIATYRRRDYQRTDLIASSADQAAQLATDWLARYSRPAARIAELTIDYEPPDTPDPLAVAAELTIGDTITATLPADTTGQPWTGTGQVIGLVWELGPYTARARIAVELPAQQMET